jgi:hypothetical protein
MVTSGMGRTSSVRRMGLRAFSYRLPMLSPPESHVWDGKNVTSRTFRPAGKDLNRASFLPCSAAAPRCAIYGRVCLTLTYPDKHAVVPKEYPGGALVNLL